MEKLFVVFILSEKVVPVVLVLEGNEGLSSEVRKGEGRRSINSILIAGIEVLLVDHINLFWFPFKKFRVRFGSFFKVFIYKILSCLVNVLKFSEIIAKGDTCDNISLPHLLLVFFVDKFVEIFVNLMGNFRLILEDVKN